MNGATDMETTGLDLTILMPCLNEAETIEVCVRKASRSLEELGLRGEVLVADNGSTDGSQDLARKLGARVVDVEKKGYGNALRTGIASARGRWVIMADADDSYDFSSLRPFVEKLRAGSQLVMGCRMPWGGGTIIPGAMPWKHKWIGNPVLSFIGRLFFHCPVTDFHCGLRGFDREAVRALDLNTGGMEFASEMVIKATFGKLRIAQVPITLHKDGRSRPPHLRSWRDGWRHLRFMLLFSPRWLFFWPGLVLAVSSAAVFLVLLRGQFIWNGITFDTNTMIVAAMMLLVGYQLLFSAVFTKAFSIASKLVPERPSFERWLSLFNLERGVVAGLALFLAGLGVLGYATWEWRAAGFGELSYPVSLRRVVPSVLLVVLGMQTVFYSFFLSVLGLIRR
jgi:glycosyltransferase involved in cell wall biosynthesis